MKKQGLLKRIALGLTAGAMIVTMLPSTLAAAETTDGSYWKTISEINMDGFTMGTKDLWSYSASKETDGHTVYVTASGEGSHWINQNSGFYEIQNIADNNKGDGTRNDGTKVPYNMDNVVNVPEIAGKNLYLLHRGVMVWEANKYKDWVRAWPSPSSSIRLQGVFDKSQIEAGDTIKITAWVYAGYIAENYKTDTKPAPEVALDQTAKTRLRMWLAAGDDNKVNDNKHNSSSPDITKRPNEAVITEIPSNEWQEISITYKADSYTKDVSSIRIDSAVADINNPYPFRLVLAGVKTEKLVQASGTYTIDDAGKVTGSVNAGINEMPSADAKAKVIVVAYQDTTFLGCSINDYTEGGSYNFTIDNVKGANDVKAYIWYMNNTEPKIKPLTLTLQ